MSKCMLDVKNVGMRSIRHQLWDLHVHVQSLSVILGYLFNKHVREAILEKYIIEREIKAPFE